MKIKFKKLTQNAVVPTKAHSTDACFDLVATSKSYDDKGNIVYGTGIAMEIPKGYVGRIFPRSSISKYSLQLTNCVGIIDSDYRGEIYLKFKPTLFAHKEGYSDQLFRHEYEVGERICQISIDKVLPITFTEVEELSSTDRGEGGFGSSGK